jgi:polyisoprenoid-binding protein YceI
MKTLLITIGIFLLTGVANAQDTTNVDTYKIAFFSKDASGVFKDMKGEIVTNGDNVPTAFDLSIQTASINTGNGIQNKHAKSSEWFHSEKYPDITFTSKEIVTNDEGVFAKGELFLHGVSKKVTLPLTIITNETNHVYKTKFSVDRVDYQLGPKSKVSPSIKIIAAVTVKK